MADQRSRDSERPLKKAMEYIQAVCERKREEGKTVVYRCVECQDHGLLYYPHAANGTTCWYPFRCGCNAKGDWGPVEFITDPKGKKIPSRSDFKEWNSEIQSWIGYQRRDGRPILREELFSLSQRSDYEDRLSGPAYTTEPDFLGAEA